MPGSETKAENPLLRCTAQRVWSKINPSITHPLYNQKYYGTGADEEKNNLPKRKGQIINCKRHLKDAQHSGQDFAYLTHFVTFLLIINPTTKTIREVSTMAIHSGGKNGKNKMPRLRSEAKKF